MDTLRQYVRHHISVEKLCTQLFCTYTSSPRSPRSLLVHVSHSLLCVGFSEGGRRNVDCVLFSGCSGNVTTARCAARVGISACLCLGACAFTL